MGTNNPPVRQYTEVLYKQKRSVVVPVIAGKSVKDSYKEFESINKSHSSEAWPWPFKKLNSLDVKELTNKIVERVVDITFTIDVTKFEPNSIQLCFHLIIDNESCVSNVVIDIFLLKELAKTGNYNLFVNVLEKPIYSLAKLVDEDYSKVNSLHGEVSNLLYINSSKSDFLFQEIMGLIKIYESGKPFHSTSSKSESIQLSLF